MEKMMIRDKVTKKALKKNMARVEKAFRMETLMNILGMKQSQKMTSLNLSMKQTPLEIMMRANQITLILNQLVKDKPNNVVLIILMEI